MLPCTSWYVPLWVANWLLDSAKLRCALQVKVSHDNLIGEVIRINGDQATIQVYEETGINQRPYLTKPSS